MTEAIKRWITNRTGIVMNMSPEIFAADVMDGTIITKILFSYAIISHHQSVKVLPTQNSMVAYKNLKKIACWLKAVGIYCNDNDLLEISNENSLSAIKLFYELYLNLHDKDKLHFAAQIRGNQRLHPNDSRFGVTSVDEEDYSFLDYTSHPVSKPLTVNRDVIEWNQNRYQTLLKTYDEMRKLYSKYIKKKFNVPITNDTKIVGSEEGKAAKILKSEFTEIEESTYDELIEQEKAAKQLQAFQADPKITKKIVKKLKHKRQQEIRDNEIKAYQQKMLLLELWNELLDKQEKDFEDSISNKLLKQSMFEKQIVTKMIEIRQQKYNMLHNRKFMDESIMKKREEEFLEQVFLKEKGVGDQKYNYYFERDRVLELHRRLYAERLRLRKERYYKMCCDIFKDITNIAIRHSEYLEQYGETEVPKWLQTEWANLFTKQQPIFGLLKDVVDIVQDNTHLPEELEEIYCIEIHRQNELDKRDFEKYADFEWPWELNDLLTDYEDNLLSIKLGMNVLGHNVHRVLLTKYPMPKPPSEPNIPKVKVAACINGLTDLTILPVLQKLLDFKLIKVLEIQQAINYCLETFKDEIKTEYIDNALIEETQAALEEVKKKKKSKKKGSEKSKKKKSGKKVLEKNKKIRKKIASVEVDGSILNFPRKIEATCQTPRIYPCEEIVLSNVGELGKTAYDLLNIGEQLTDNLIVAMYVEYLKTLKDIEGWILINYPTNFMQAVVLEEALTGTCIHGISSILKVESPTSIGDVADLQYRESQWEEEDKNAILRQSKLLPNPTPPEDESYYNTILSAYISVHLLEQNLETEKDNASSDCEIAKSVPNKLDEFYSNQGCNYAFYYKTFDLETIKHLAKLIIGEYTIPPKTSLELFGETLLYVEANLDQYGVTPGKEPTSEKLGEKKKPPKVVKKKEPPQEKKKKESPKKSPKKSKKKQGSSTKKDKKGKKGKTRPHVKIIAVTYEDKAVQIPEEATSVETLFKEPPPPEPIAGEALWRYDDLDFPESFQLSLSSLWENIENVYMGDFQQLFFIKRVLLKAVVPYLTYVKKHMELFITRPDNKQTHVYEFQRVYNEMDDDMRDDDEVKAEIHCRITEFRESIWEICDKRMQESENERQRIIQECWLPYQASEFTNNYINAMQLEIDRCCDSFQFIIDYYHGTITKMPCGEPQLQKTVLTKIVMEDSQMNVTSTASKLEEAMASILTLPGTSSEGTYFHQVINTRLLTAKTAIDKWKSISSSLINKMNALFKPGKKKGVPKSKRGKSAKKDVRAFPPFFEPEPKVLEIGNRLIEEWTCAVKGEYLRAKMRLNMLAERALRDINDILTSCQKAFQKIYEDIKDRYKREIDSANKICEVLAQAVEAEVKIQPELILDGDKFYIEPMTLLFPEPLPEPDPPVREPEIEGQFTIEQLDVIVTILMQMAPSASIPERAFVFLLQDLIVQRAEDGQGSMVPPLWQQLSPKQVSKLSREIFGDVEFIDWRDFIIYNLCLTFPSQEDLISVRSQFRQNDPDLTEVVLSYQFLNVSLWFEVDFSEESPQEMLRLNLIKKLLLKMYKVEDDGFNYTAFLLGFCKDLDPMEGFAKGLALILGNNVCWDTTLGMIYIRSVLEQRYLDEQAELERRKEHEQIMEFSESIIDSLIDTTVHLCDSIIIEDYESEKSMLPTVTPSETIYCLLHNENHGVCEIEKPAVVKIFSKELKFSDTVVKFEDESMEEAFSNVDIGFEPHYNKNSIYHLSLDTVLMLITTTLPWHAKAQTVNDKSIRQRLETIFYSLKREDFNNNVFAFELLNNKEFKSFLLNKFKFVQICPPKIVYKMVFENSI